MANVEAILQEWREECQVGLLAACSSVGVLAAVQSLKLHLSLVLHSSVTVRSSLPVPIVNMVFEYVNCLALSFEMVLIFDLPADTFLADSVARVLKRMSVCPTSLHRCTVQQGEMLLVDLVEQTPPRMIWPPTFLKNGFLMRHMETPVAMLPRFLRELVDPKRRWSSARPFVFGANQTQFVVAAHRAQLPWPPWFTSKSKPGAVASLTCPLTGLHLDHLPLNGLMGVECLSRESKALFQKLVPSFLSPPRTTEEGLLSEKKTEGFLQEKKSELENALVVWCSKAGLRHSLVSVFGAAHPLTETVENLLSVILPVLHLDSLGSTTPFAALDGLFRQEPEPRF